jgi:iron complex outermembrane receptor protein
MKTHFSSTALSTGVLTGVLFAILALPSARAAAADAAPAVSDGFEEVVVTAQKRTQNLQEVPLSVQVIGAEQLAAAGIENFEDFNRVAPSLLIRTDVTPINSSVAIRGIGTSAFGIGVEPSTAVVVDDVPLAFQARAFGNMSDISRVEVLAGPQSTLYGKSATAGLINIVTPGPTSSFSAGVNATGTTDAERDFGGYISGPIGDKLAYRVSGSYNDFPGVVKNLYTGDHSDGSETYNLHGKLVWDPTSQLNVALNLNYDKGTTTNDLAFISLPANAFLHNNPKQPPSNWLNGVTPGFDNTDVYNNTGIGTRYANDDQSLKISYDFGSGGPTLMSISSHSFFFLKDHQDTDYTALAAGADIDTVNGAPTASGNSLQEGYFHNTQWTEEVRLVSPGTGPFRYTTGLYYAKVDYSRIFARGPFSPAGWHATEQSEQEAAFGQVEYDILDQLTLIAGARLGQERVSCTFQNLIATAPFTCPTGAQVDQYGTYRIGPQYQLTDDVMLFALHSTGHKGQTFNLATGFGNNAQSTALVRPETSSNYEVGAKMQFFGHHLTVNPTIFTTEYTNFQAQGLQNYQGVVSYQLENVGTVRTRGIELSNSLKATRDLTFDFDATYLDANVLSFPGAQCWSNTLEGNCSKINGQFTQDLSGKKLYDAPKWKLSADANYVKNFGFIPWDNVFQASYSYTSAVNYALTLDPYTVQKGYGILNLSAGLRDPSEKYQITLFVDNALNTHYHGDIQDLNGTFGAQEAIAAIVPRDFSTYAGIRASAKF